MNQHVHGHSLVSGGGLSLDGQRFLAFPSGTFLPLSRLARSFAICSSSGWSRSIAAESWCSRVTGGSWTGDPPGRSSGATAHDRLDRLQPRRLGSPGGSRPARGSDPGRGVPGPVCQSDRHEQQPAGVDRRPGGGVSLPESSPAACGRPRRCPAWSSSSVFCGIWSPGACGASAAWLVGQCRADREAALLRRLLGVRPPESADEPPPTPREEGAGGTAGPGTAAVGGGTGHAASAVRAAGRWSSRIRPGVRRWPSCCGCRRVWSCWWRPGRCNCTCRSPPFCDHPTRREETDSMPR